MKLGPYGASALFFFDIDECVLDGEKPEEQIDTDAELYDKI
jgi:hypothetical protein